MEISGLSWRHNALLSPSKPHHVRLRHNPSLLRPSRVVSLRAFQRSDFDGFAKRVKSGEALRDAWKGANDKFELFMYEARKTAERLDREYEVSRKVNSAVRSAQDKAKEIDREYEIGVKWRSFTLEFTRNWPRYRKEIGDAAGSPLGRSVVTVFFLWFALSGWLFRVLIFGVWVLPLAGPLLIGSLANSLVIKGDCPACKRQFVGNRTQIVRCAGCGNIVWQPTGDPFPRNNRGTNSRGSTSSKSNPDFIDVEYEER